MAIIRKQVVFGWVEVNPRRRPARIRPGVPKMFLAMAPETWPGTPFSKQQINMPCKAVLEVCCFIFSDISWPILMFLIAIVKLIITIIKYIFIYFFFFLYLSNFPCPP